MKTVSKISALFAVTLLVVGAAAGQVTTSAVTGTTEFNPQAGVGGVNRWGVVFCPGNEPTGNPFQPCPLGSKIMIRGRQIWFPMRSDDARAVGPIILNISANYNADLTGQEWGTFTHILDAGGTFEGVVTSVRTFENGRWKGTIRGVGHGSGGAVEGTILKFTIIDTYTSPSAFAGQFEGALTQVPRAQ